MGLSRFHHIAILLLLAGLFGTEVQAQSARVRDRAEVRGARILLSDLLDTPDASLVAVAHSIDLGRSPQPGSPRVLPGEQIGRRLSSEPRLRSLSVPERITVSNPGWEVQREALWIVLAQYLHERGWADEQLPDPGTLKWPHTMRTLRPEPPLQVTNVEWSATQHALQVHARCMYAVACGSFLVEAPVLNAPPQLRTRSRELGRTHVANARGGRVVPRILVAGKRAMLTLDSAGMRISLPVVPLQPGALGQTIRVREWKGNRTYNAEVVGPCALHASL